MPSGGSTVKGRKCSCSKKLNERSMESRNEETREPMRTDRQPVREWCERPDSTRCTVTRAQTSDSRKIPQKNVAASKRTVDLNERSKNQLNSTLQELLSKTRPISENVLPESAQMIETKLEPEVIAAAFLMSEDEAANVGGTKFVDIAGELILETAATSAKTNHGPVVQPSANAPATPDTGWPLRVEVEVPAATTETEAEIAPRADSSVGRQSADPVAAAAVDVANELTNGRTSVDAHDRNVPGNSERRASDNETTLEYVIAAEPAAYRNRIRLNGSVTPAWFPGYTLVSPLLPEGIEMTSDPGEALHEGWRLCRPRHFDELSKSLVNTG